MNLFDPVIIYTIVYAGWKRRVGYGRVDGTSLVLTVVPTIRPARQCPN